MNQLVIVLLELILVLSIIFVLFFPFRRLRCHINRFLIWLAKVCLRLAGESQYDIDKQFEIFDG